MIGIGGYWIGRNKGYINKGQLLIGKRTGGGIPIRDFIAGRGVKLFNPKDNKHTN